MEKFMNKPDVKSLFRSSLFWDAEDIDADRHAHYIIARILDFGDFNDVRILRNMYPDEKIIEVIRSRRGLSPKTGKFWAVKFGIPLEEVRCLKKYYQERLSA